MRKLSLLVGLTILGVLAVALSVAPAAFAQSRGPSGADGTYNCADFDTQRQAQQFFLAHNPSQDPDGLDGPVGHDSTGVPGVACENLPAPKDLTPAPGYAGASTNPAATPPAATASTTPTGVANTRGTLARSGGPELLIPAVALLLGFVLLIAGLVRRNP